ncbi:MAG: HD domain-containing protein [Planctomycetota bacterium]|nr:MAG: HD domain-containing protein [Planctomycetota bacterium]
MAKLAVFLAERLQEKGIRVDVELLDRACLLHDIARVCDFRELDYSKFEQRVTEEDKAKWRHIRAMYGGMGHEEAAYDILKQKYPRLALTIRKHRYMAMLDEKVRPDTLEEKLAYYADMRVMEDRIVPLKERLEDGHKRNVHLHGTEAQSKINTAKVDPLIYRLEAEIFDKLDLQPLDVTDEFIDLYTDGREPKG